MDHQHKPINEQIEEYFIEFKSKASANGRAFSNGQSVKHFVEAEKICRELKADPYDFVASCFANRDPNRMLPSFLHSKNVKADYQAYMATRVSVDYESLFNLNKLILETQLKKGFSEEDILLTRMIPFEPWFRVTYPKKPYESIMQRYGEEASEQNCEKLRSFLFNKNINFNRLFL